MATTTWDPFAEMATLRDALDRLLRDSFLRVSTSSASDQADWFPIDLAETEDGYLVRAYLPGICPENAHLSTHGDRLTIRAELPDQDESAHTWLARERQGGVKERTIRLPTAIDAERARARCEHGVLRIELPKAASAKPRRITVTSAEQAGHGQNAEMHVESDDRVPESQLHREDVVTESSEMSFPASDPPAWTPGKPGGGAED